MSERWEDWENWPIDLVGRWYLMSSYAYYILHSKSILPDEVYDKMCVRILNEYDGLDDDRKRVIDKDSLQSGTAYQMKDEDYPESCKGGLTALLQDMGWIKMMKKKGEWKWVWVNK